MAHNIPLSGNSTKLVITFPGHPSQSGEPLQTHYVYGVQGDYFAAMGIPLRAGRALGKSDPRRAERVCVVDEDMARRHWPQGDVLGQRLFLGAGALKDADAFTVIGVVGAVKQAGVTEQEGQGAVYVPYPYFGERGIYVVARAAQSPEALGSALRQAVREVDPGLPVSAVQSMEGRLEDSLIARRSPALLAALFACVALLLTAVGTYGVIAYAVGQRRREIGVRIALGALPQQVRAQFLSMGSRLLVAGVLCGTLGAWLAGRLMANLLFNTPPLQPGLLALVACVMGAVVLLASLLPAFRAARISPTEAIRGE
jgi:uncharacterized membrane protein YeaQ/YmgE (transglycosylase-associated protein family)